MNKKIVEKFINNTCSVEEAGRVLDWLATEEGQVYLSIRLHEDAQLLRNKKLKPFLPAMETEKMWKEIEAQTEPSPAYELQSYSQKYNSSIWYAAAVLFLVCGLSVFYYMNYSSAGHKTETEQATHIVAGSQHQRTLTLYDGTKIRLNKNAELWVSATYGQAKRQVTLEGEAFFEITHDASKPFIIHTKGILIKDLGTAFNVRSLPGKKNVQIAVKEGKVSVLPQKEASLKTDEVIKSIHLTGGQYAYVDLRTHLVSVSKFEVDNYFSWMNNRLGFDNVSLAQASKQLSRIYDVTFSFAAEPLKAKSFSANFQKESLKKTLSVIALTLSIDYQLKDNHVIWRKRQ